MSRIIILGPSWPFRGGLAAFNERLAEELIRMGHEVILITFTVQYPNLLFPGKSQMATEAAPENLLIYRWIHSFNPLNWVITGKKIKDLKPDYILCKFWLPMMGPCFGTIIRLGKIKKTRIISILDNVVPHEHRPGDKLFTRYFLSSVDQFVYMSESVGADLRKFEPTKSASLIPHPIYDNYGTAVSMQDARSKLGLDPDQKYILFFGFIRDYKGLDLLLRVMALPNIISKKIKLIVAGEYYTDPAPYQQIINELNLQDKLILRTDFIPNDLVKYYFCATDLVVQPYKTATQSGIAQIAIHFTRPTIVTRVGGLHEIIEDGITGFVVNPDIESIASGIVQFFDQANPETFSQALINTREKYSWHRLALAITQTNATVDSTCLYFHGNS